MEIFETIKGIIELIISIITLVFIAFGLKTWKIQLKGTWDNVRDWIR
jgi:uncharacterized membrane protein YbhN (UPF0104 family)